MRSSKYRTLLPTDAVKRTGPNSMENASTLPIADCHQLSVPIPTSESVRLPSHCRPSGVPMFFQAIDSNPPESSAIAADANIGGALAIEERKRDRAKKFIREKGPRIVGATAGVGMLIFNIVTYCS